MKTRLIILASIIISIQMGCKKEDVYANEEHVFNISAETKDWLPNKILTEEIKFQSENGEMIIFQKDTIFHREHDWIFFNPCGDGNKKETIYYERITHSYSSGDTANISMSTNIVNTGCGWVNVNEVKLMEQVFVNVRKWRQNHTESVDIGALLTRQLLIRIY